jgi:hypothetical protein
MNAQYRLLIGCVMAAAFVGAAGCSNSEKGREEMAAREFHQRLAQNRVDLIYANASDQLKAQWSEAQFRKMLSQTQAYGVLQSTERAHYARTPMNGSSDVVLAYYNSRFATTACLESFSWRTEGTGLKLETYSCAANMQVTCSDGGTGAKCETSPTPQPGFASSY